MAAKMKGNLDELLRRPARLSDNMIVSARSRAGRAMVHGRPDEGDFMVSGPPIGGYRTPTISRDGGPYPRHRATRLHASLQFESLNWS